MRQIFLQFLFVLLLVGCSADEDQSVSEEHVWKSQTDTLDKAREVEDILSQDAADKGAMIDGSDY